MEIYYNEFLISDHKEWLDMNVIKGYLARSYWANQRSAPCNKENKHCEQKKQLFKNSNYSVPSI